MGRTNQELITNMIPYEDQLYVDRLRKFLGDTAELNVLDEVKESTDIELHHAIQDTIDEINYEFLPGTEYKKISEVPSWNLVKLGATLQILTSKGILSSRNTLTYQDSGGVTVQDFDKYGRYINYYNILINKFVRGVSSMKLNANVDAAYGGVPSEYGIESGEDDI
mgnify:FL=1